MNVRLPDGTVIENVPDGTTKADIIGKLKSSGREVPADWLAAAPAPAGPTERDQLLSSAPMRLAKGAKDPIDGAAQFLSRVPGAEYVNRAANAVGGAINRVIGAKGDFAGEVLGIRGMTPQQIDADIAGSEAEYEKARKATAAPTLSSLVTGERDPGFDGMRLLGNVISPANAGIARALPMAGAATAGARAVQGVAGGTLASLVQPVVTDDSEQFAARKGGQVALGAVAGGVLAPVAGAVGDRISQAVANYAARGKPVAVDDIERIVRTVSQDMGQRWEDMGPQMQAQMRAQVAESLQAAGGRRDAASLVRQADFQREGMQGTLGQVGRDPRQFATEMNLRQVPGTGDPLLQRMSEQNRQLQSKVGRFGQGAQQDFQAGETLIKPLRAYDAKLSSEVSREYGVARAAAGKDVELPMQGLSQDVARIMDDFEGSVPPSIVNRLKRFGIIAGQEGDSAPRKLYTPEEADKLIKLINQSGNATDRGSMAALTQLRKAVGASLDEPFKADANLSRESADAFNKARGLASQRFKLHDAMDGLAAVARGEATPDTFVNRYIIGLKDSAQVTQMADILRKESPEAYEQARAQIGAKLGRAAFGENMTGDKAFSAERFSKTLRDLGDEKLSAFFDSKELEQLHRLARIGAYVNQAPAKAPINTSGNWSAIMNVAGRIPGLGSAVQLARAAQNTITTGRNVDNALAARIPQQAAEVDPAAVARLSQLVGAGSIGVGALTGSAVK